MSEIRDLYNEDLSGYSNFIAYFKSIDDKDFSVRLISDNTSTTFKEIVLAGDSPFIVNYAGGDTLYEPVKTSTATIKIVSNHYLEHILSPYAHGTKVELLEGNKLVWVGYLTPKIYDQSWVNEFEEIDLEAADCLSSLQYFDYEELNSKGLVSFKQILDFIVDKCEAISGYYWPQSKRLDDVYLTPSDLGVYEKNFFTNDTDEPWKCDEVLFEICQFLGLTCVQSFDRLYFLDYDDFMSQTITNSKYDYYAGDTTYSSYWYMGDNLVNVDADTFRGNDGSISFQPIYNKVIVKDNMYNCEELFPAIFDDKYLTNINGEFYHAVEAEPLSEYASYPYGSSWGNQKYVNEETPDTKYRYFLRIYDHKWWETVYDGQYTLYGGDAVQLLMNILQGRIVDHGIVAKNTYENGQMIIPNTVDYTRYVCIPTKHTDANQNTGKVVLRLKDGFKMPCMVTKDSYLLVQSSVLFERHNGRPYINPDWTSSQAKIRLPANSSSYDRIAWPRYRLTIGDKAWSGFHKKWVELDNYHNYFEPAMEWQQDDMDYWNTEMNILNQVSWETNINEPGYLIPLADVDLSEEIYFEILCPAPSNYGVKDGEYFMMKYNAYCWIKDLVVKIVEKGQDVDKQDNDIVYENVVDEDSISELGEFTFKLTTHNENTKPSYSNVIYLSDEGNTFLTTIVDRGLSSAEQNAEENCIERYVNQYNTQTRKLSLTLTTEHTSNNYNSIITPFTCMDITYIPIGTEIDYAMAKEHITMIEKKA